MLVDRAGVLCGAGRGLGMRATDGRFFTGRRTVGRAIGLGATGFFALALAGDLRTAGFLAAALPRLRVPDPFFDVFLAMTPSCCLASATLSHEVRTLE